MKIFQHAVCAALVAVLGVGAAAALPALGQNAVTVLVNGQVLRFDQPPVMRNSRVFVPMRAIFERLGSTVAYSNGQINAQGNGRSVHLTLGSNTATINGQPLQMDVAPFTVAGRTEVPLRFVAQALGASVNWNGNTQTVYINSSNSSSSSSNESYTPQPQNNASFYLTGKRPATHANSIHPNIHAQFSEPIDQNSLRVSIDGRDVTSLVYANPSGFDVSPNFALNSGTHHVTVTGTTRAGAGFNTGWSFTTSNGATANYINGLSPAPGAKVGSSFTFSGHTLPGSSVHIVAAGQQSALGGLFQINTGTFQTDVTADGNGRFSADISVNASSGGQVRLIVTSTSPSGASIERQIVYGG
jgi:hypothetical protein